MSTTVFDIAGRITGTSAGAIPQFARVTGPVGPNRVFTLAGLTARADGIAQTATSGASEALQVKMLSGADTNFGIAAGAITAGDKLYGAADGELSDTQGVGAFAEGYAIQDAAAGGDPLEWRYKPELTAGTE